MKYQLINYFDVWGNKEDGYTVNNQCVEFDDLVIADDATEKDILRYLQSIGFLSTADRRRVRVDMSNEVMEIYAVKDTFPIGALIPVY